MNNDNLATIYIVRHGQTDWNVKKIIQGQLDIPLNETGEKQAAEAAKQFKDVAFDFIFSSDLLRAKRTAEIIALEHKLAVETTHALRERAFGELEGKPTQVFFAYRELIHALSDEQRKEHTPYEGFENDEAFSTRIITFLRETAIAFPKKTILMATHGGALRMILVHLGYFDYKTIDTYSFGNLSSIKIKTDGVDFFIEELKGITKVEE